MFPPLTHRHTHTHKHTHTQIHTDTPQLRTHRKQRKENENWLCCAAGSSTTLTHTHTHTCARAQKSKEKRKERKCDGLLLNRHTHLAHADDNRHTHLPSQATHTPFHRDRRSTHAHKQNPTFPTQNTHTPQRVSTLKNWNRRCDAMMRTLIPFAALFFCPQTGFSFVQQQIVWRGSMGEWNGSDFLTPPSPQGQQMNSQPQSYKFWFGLYAPPSCCTRPRILVRTGTFDATIHMSICVAGKAECGELEEAGRVSCQTGSHAAK